MHVCVCVYWIRGWGRKAHLPCTLFVSFLCQYFSCAAFLLKWQICLLDHYTVYAHRYTHTYTHAHACVYEVKQCTSKPEQNCLWRQQQPSYGGNSCSSFVLTACSFLLTACSFERHSIYKVALPSSSWFAFCTYYCHFSLMHGKIIKLWDCPLLFLFWLLFCYGHPEKIYQSYSVTFISQNSRLFHESAVT